MSPLAIKGNPSHKRQMWLQQHMRCYYCRRLTDIDLLLNNQVRNCYSYTATEEHVIPRSRGGSGKSLENRVMSCDRCNCVRNTIELCLGKARWSKVDVPLELFMKLLPVDFDRWQVYNRSRLDAVIESMRWGQ